MLGLREAGWNVHQEERHNSTANDELDAADDQSVSSRDTVEGEVDDDRADEHHDPESASVLRHLAGQDAFGTPCIVPRTDSHSGLKSKEFVVDSLSSAPRVVEAVRAEDGSGSKSDQTEDSSDGEDHHLEHDSEESDSDREAKRSKSTSGEDEDHHDADAAEGATELLLADVVQSDGAEVVVDSFGELRLRDDLVQAMKETWRLFLATSQTQEAAGEAIYSALFEGAPSLQPLFTTPRAVQAMRFMTGLHSFIMNVEDPPQLKTLVETLSFGHLHLDVTIARVAMFRDAILDLFSVELGERFDTMSYEGWRAMMNYIGGAIIYVKAHYADRIKTLQDSWLACVEKGKQSNDGSSGMLSADNSGSAQFVQTQNAKASGQGSKASQPSNHTSLVQRGANMLSNHHHQGDGEKHNADTKNPGNNQGQQQVPTTYTDMFRFNAVVMGFSSRKWFNEVLACFHDLVMNVSNSIRFQEECDVLTLRIAKVVKGSVVYSEYKSCMLASLRSLLPKEWSTNHEVAWSWLWDNVENLLKKHQGQPPNWEKALVKAYSGIDDAKRFELRKDIYIRFFDECPAGQNYFKQSNTYLHIIAEKILEMTLDMYKEPVRLVDDISSLGLRHVGYGIPTEYFGPFVSACVMVMQTGYMSDVTALEAFRWSLALVSRMLVRTIREGSTIVMKAINTNSTKQLKKAIACSPRGERALWCLVVQVGTQSISPLAWAIQSGRLQAASTILDDLLTIRADRDRYYYGVDDLFARHPDIVQLLCQHAPKLLSVLFDGLIWRSRITEQGLRRVNYFIKHLLVDAEGNFANTFRWVVDFGDPKIVCHPVLVLLSDSVWSKAAYLTFLWGKSLFLFNLLIFLASQSLLGHTGASWDKSDGTHIAIFACRCVVYLGSMLKYLRDHVMKTIRSYRQQDTVRILGITLPSYLESWQEVTGLLLTITLITMLCMEPILHCAGKTSTPFGEDCEAGKELDTYYSTCSMLAVFLYYLLLIDFAAVSNRVSAFVLLCSQMLPELALFLLALAGLIVAFGSAACVLTRHVPNFDGLHEAFITLFRMSLSLYAEEDYDSMHDEPAVFVLALGFLVATLIFLINMLIAQLTCAYGSIYVDMSGFARLSRLEVIVETMPSVPPKRWKRFLDSLKLDKKIEFNSGDVGLDGGIQVREPSGANPTTIDMIRRFGGSTSPSMQWPEDVEERDGDEAARFDRMEKVVQKTLKKITRATAGDRTRGSSTDIANGSDESFHSSDSKSGSETGG